MLNSFARYDVLYNLIYLNIEEKTIKQFQIFLDSPNTNARFLLRAGLLLTMQIFFFK